MLTSFAWLLLNEVSIWYKDFPYEIWQIKEMGYHTWSKDIIEKFYVDKKVMLLQKSCFVSFLVYFCSLSLFPF